MSPRKATALLVSAVLFALGATQANAQSGLKVTEVKPVFSKTTNARYAVLSPDGKTIVYTGTSNSSQQPCLYDIASEKETCITLTPQNRAPITSYTWAPDSKHIAFAQDPWRVMRDSDLWIIDVEKGTAADVTDDDYDGNLLSLDKNPTPVNIDYTPRFDPTGSIVYFFRTIRDTTTKSYTLDLYKIPVTGGEAEYVHTLLGAADDLTNSVYDTSFIMNLHGVADISPDGKTLAVAIQPIKKESQSRGIWLMDTSGSGAPTPLVSITSEFRTGMPAFIKDFMPAISLQWEKSGKGILVSVLDATGAVSNMIRGNLYYVEVATKQITPLLDFSDIASAREAITPDKDGIVRAQFTPFYVAYLPANDAVLTFYGNTIVQDLTLNAVHVPPAAPLKISEIVYTFDRADYKVVPAMIASASTDGKKALLAGFLISLE